jgi:hypothetical protein
LGILKFKTLEWEVFKESVKMVCQLKKLIENRKIKFLTRGLHRTNYRTLSFGFLYFLFFINNQKKFSELIFHRQI